MTQTYTVYRHFMNGGKEVIKAGLTLKEAKEHCSDPQTSSKTAEGEEMEAYTRKHGPWFDGFDAD